MWPFRRRRRDENPEVAPNDPEPSRDEWASLPRPPRLLEPFQLTLNTETFEPELSTRKDPELFLAPLEHEVSEEAPSGLIEGLGRVIEPSQSRAESKTAQPAAASIKPTTLQSAPVSPPRSVQLLGDQSIVQEALVLPPPNPTMTRAPSLEQPLPPRVLLPLSPETHGVDHDMSPTEPQTVPTVERRAAVSDVEPSRSETLPVEEELPLAPAPPRKMGLGEPMTSKPIRQPTEEPSPTEFRLENTENLAPGTEAELIPPLPEPEMVLPPTSKIEDSIDRSGSGELAIELRRDEGLGDVAETGPPRFDARETVPAARVVPTRAARESKDLPLKFASRPTLGVTQTPVQRHVIDSPSAPTKPRPSTESRSVVERPATESTVPSPQSALTDASTRGEVSSETSAGPTSKPALVRRLIPIDSPPRQKTVGSVGQQPSAVEIEMPIIHPAESRHESSSSPEVAMELAKPPIKTEVPSAHVEQVVVLEREKEPAPMEPQITVQREVSSAPAFPPTVAETKDETDSAADEMYEKIRLRMRKELRLYQEQAGLHTYRGR